MQIVIILILEDGGILVICFIHCANVSRINLQATAEIEVWLDHTRSSASTAVSGITGHLSRRAAELFQKESWFTLKRFVLYSVVLCFYKTSFKSCIAALSGLPGSWAPTWHTNESDTLKLTITVRGLKAPLPPWELIAREAVLLENILQSIFKPFH